MIFAQKRQMVAINSFVLLLLVQTTVFTPFVAAFSHHASWLRRPSAATPLSSCDTAAFGNSYTHTQLNLRQAHFSSRSRSSSSLFMAVMPPPPLPPPSPPTGLETQALYDLIFFFNRINSILFEQYQTALTTILSSVQSSLQEVQEVAHLGEQFLQQQVQVMVPPSLQPFVEQVEQAVLQGDNQFMQYMVEHPALAALATGVVTFGLVSSLLSSDSKFDGPAPSQPYPLSTYDPIAARMYFDRRWPMALARTAQIGWTSLSFGLSLWIDQITNQLEERADERGMQLAVLLTQLGPTFIKVGQSLSIRTDLLSPAYIRGLASLQDQVPPFDTQTALRLLQEEWGVSNIDLVLQDISPQPIAAASLGQVYKATLRKTANNVNTTVVAIKVQRPDIMEQIALDMYLLRETAPVLKSLFKLNTDTVGTVDAWGKGFVDELDYVQEAKNAKVFSEEIAKTPLKVAVLAPRVVDEFTTRQVLVTEWINGERLDKSSASDVTILCSVAMNTYLTMMLEIGLLHSDPHPGNLLRTPEGQLCVLDWGMVTRLDRKLQLTLIEHMAHLTSADYEEIPRDLALLGFIPPDKAKSIVKDSDVVQVLAEIYSAWTKGGGAATINVNRVVAQLQDLQATRGNLFQIPPYFAYIAKSFSVLEGIGLSNDPNYSIINECLPYVSKRLLTDKDTMGPALSTFLFGPEKTNIDTRIVDYKRVEQLVTGFGNYTSSALFSGAALATTTSETAFSTSRPTPLRRRTASQQQQFLETAADQVLDLVLTEEETPFQQILLEQLAKIISSTGRSIWTQLRERSGTLPSGRTVLGTLVDPLGLWRTSPLVRMNELDERTVETTQKLLVLLQQQLESNNQLDLSTLTREEIVDLSSILGQKVWDRRLGVLKTGNRLAMKLMQLTADKLDKGERDTRKINSPLIEPSIAQTQTASTDTFSQELERRLPSMGSSPRLESARQLLEQLQLRRDQEDDFASSVLPVKTKL